MKKSIYALILAFILVATCIVSCGGPTEAPTESGTESVTETPTEAPTESGTESVTEAPTESVTESVTEAPTESATESVTEAPTESATESVTEAPTESGTESVTEAPTESATESVTEAPTESATEAPTEAPTESATELVTEAPTESATESVTDPVTEEPEEDNMKFTDISPANGSTVMLANSKVADFWHSPTVESAQKYYRSGDIYAPEDVSFTWVIDESAKSYKITLSTNEDLSDATVYTTKKASLTVRNLFTSTAYYWQIEAVYSDRTEKSPVFSFTTAESPRCIFIEGVSNSRDIGGMKVSDTQRIREGMIYRAGSLDSISHDAVEIVLYELGIATDLDLRRSGEGTAGKASPLGMDINYINISGVYYVTGDSGIRNGEAALVREIKVFAERDNYPILMHCSIGRDRTGCLAIILQGLLGASKEDIIRDYNLSFLSSSGCADDAGTVAVMNGFVNDTIAYIEERGGGDSFKESVENYLLKIGVKEREIAAIRDIMLENIG